MSNDRRILLRVSGLYLVFAVAWIVGSDQLVKALGLDADAALHAQTAKGIAFVTLSTLIIYALLARELHARRRAEDAAQRLEGELQTAQKLEALGRLAGGVAHDFNNLLTVIGGNASLLADSLAESDPRRIEAKSIAEAAASASQLTQQLLAFGRRRESAPGPVNINDIISTMEPILRRLVGRELTMELVMDPALSKVDTEASQLEQILLNLVVNARDAISGQGVVRVETRNLAANGDPGRYVALTVSDTRAGMSEETRAHLFERFFTTKPEGKGTGLGLSTVQDIVRRSRGQITVQTELGKGSRFEVRLPART